LVTREREPAVKVKDVMTSPVVTVGANDTADKVAKLMAKGDIGSIVVVDKKGNPWAWSLTWTWLNE